MQAQSTLTALPTQPSEVRGSGVAHTTAYAMTSLAVAAIWISVVLATALAPDMISGSQHEHLPLVGFTIWLWGAIATGFVVQTTVDGLRRGYSRSAWLALGFGVVVIWLGVLLVTVLAPTFVTGTDPTTIPLAALGAPIAGLVLTSLLCSFVKAVEPLPAASQPVSTIGFSGSTVAANLRDLAALRDAGIVTDAEFETKKTELLGRM